MIMGYKEKVIALLNSQELSKEQKEKLEDIFPELTETEDDRIRKELIENLRELSKMYDTLQTEKEYSKVQSWITWLEKQGEQDPYNGVSFKYNGHTWGMCARDNGVDILLDRQLIKHLEKQGKQEEPQVYKTKDGEIIAYFETDGYKVEQKTQGKSALEAIKEEKVDNANKVEPKFKAEDWIVRELDNSVHQVKAVIENISNGKYGYDLTKGGYISSQDANFYHLWTIQDAKDGDVLYSPTHHLIWIYKDNEHYYACVNMNYVTENVATDGLINIPSDVRPATKEQRKQLEKAMADAGYTFDFDKKELKKIENKPADKVVPFDKYEGLTDFEGTLADICLGWISEEEPGWKQYIKDNANVLLRIAFKQFNSVQEQKPTVWSEDDEVMLDEIIDFFENGTVKLQHDLSLYASWLKSLKGRVGCEANCTTIKEWSEEDIATISRVISIVKWAAYSNHSHPILNDEGATKLIERLQSLRRPMKWWRPTWEQLDALEYHLKHTNENSRLYKETKKLYDQLKKL